MIIVEKEKIDLPSNSNLEAAPHNAGLIVLGIFMGLMIAAIMIPAFLVGTGFF